MTVNQFFESGLIDDYTYIIISAINKETVSGRWFDDEILKFGENEIDYLTWSQSNSVTIWLV